MSIRSTKSLPAMSTLARYKSIRPSTFTLSLLYQFLIYFTISRQGDAPDVVNYEEYQDLVKNTILSAPAGKPVVIFVEMPSIEKSAKRVVSRRCVTASMVATHS